MPDTWLGEIFRRRRRSRSSSGLVVARLGIEYLDQRINPSPTVSSLGSNTQYVDSTSSPTLPSTYVGYQLTGDGSTYRDVYATIGNFSAGISTATNAPSQIRLGNLTGMNHVNAYFYVTPTVSTSAETYTVTFTSGPPSLGNVLATYNESISSVVDTIKASANKFTGGSITGPSSLTIGSTFNLIVQGSTGTIGNPVIAYTPATLSNWLASSFRLISTQIAFTSGSLSGTTLNDVLFYQPPPADTSSSNYTETFQFQAINSTSSPTPVSPISYIGSGSQVKHTDSGTWASLPTIPAVSNGLFVSLAAGSVSGGVSTLTLTVQNTGTNDASLDQLVAALPSGLTYVTESSTLAGSAYMDPSVVSGNLVWSDNFSVAAGSSLVLTFQVNVPESGIYQVSGYAKLGNTQIDTTARTDDNAPAVVSVSQLPIISGLSPTSGPAVGGTTVTITGSGFTGATAVNFGSTAATSYTVVNSTTITAVAPAGTGVQDVTVTTPSGTSSTAPADQYTYIAAPAISGLSPTSGPAVGGTTVTITGSGFTGATAVNFGSTAATSYTVVNSTTITAVAPAGTGVQDVTVTTPSGTSSTAPADQYTYIAAPAISGLSPTSGPAVGGTTVTITGSGFTGATAVNFGSTAATSYTVVNSTTITAVAPAGTGVQDVTVTTPSGTSSTAPADQYTYIAAPAISGLSPTSGPAVGGTTVTITGSGFTGATAVNFGSTAAISYTVVNSTTITAVAPAGTGVQDVTVTTPSGTSSTAPADQYTYIAAPAISGLSPTSGPAVGGTTVTITGSGFTGATAVNFGSTAATSYTVVNSTTITAVAPAGTGVQDVTVTTPSGTSSTAPADQYTYIAAPAISGLSPTSGPAVGGTTVTITGSGFTGATAVNFGSTAATSYTVVNSTTITAVSPASTATSVGVTVITPSGTSGTMSFTYTLVATTTTVSGSPAPSTYGHAVTFTATVTTGITGTPTGTINFYLGQSLLGSGTLVNGQASYTTTTLLPGGIDTITATYLGDSHFDTSTSTALSQVVAAKATTSHLDVPVSSFEYGEPISFHAIVTSGLTLAPDGSVELVVDNTVVATAPLTTHDDPLSAANTFSDAIFAPFTLPSPGPHSFVLTYAGNANFAASNDNTHNALSPLTVNKAGVTPTISDSAATITYGNSITFTTTVSPPHPDMVTPTGTVEFWALYNNGTGNIAVDLGPGTLDGAGAASLTKPLLPAGNYTQIHVTYSGDANYTTTNDQNLTTLLVNPSNSTVVLTSTSLAPVYGQALTLTAAVTPAFGGVATGTVNFLNGSTLLGTATINDGLATLTTSTLAVGDHSLTAVYLGDNNVLAGDSAPLSQMIGPMGTSTTLAVSPDSTTFGQPLTFTATVTPQFPETVIGSVNFYNGTILIGSGTVNEQGQATLTVSNIPIGSNVITAVFGSTTNMLASTSAPLTQTIAKSKTVVGTVLSSRPQSYYGQSVVFTATFHASPVGSAPMTGTVDFYDGRTYLGTSPVSETAALSTVRTATIHAMSMTVTGQAVLPTTNLSIGNHFIKAIYSGDANYSTATSEIPVSVNVIRATTGTTLTVASSGPTTTLTASVVATSPGSPSLVGTVTFYDGTTRLGTVPVSNGIATLPLNYLEAGMHHFTATFSGGGTFSASGGTTTISTDGPKVINVQRYGYHNMPTTLVITFDSALDAATAQNPLNYRITGPGGSIAVLSATYNPTLHTVTLQPASHLDLHLHYTLVVVGNAPGGVKGVGGNLLDGAGTGHTGSNFLTNVDAANLVIIELHAPGAKAALRLAARARAAFTRRR